MKSSSVFEFMIYNLHLDELNSQYLVSKAKIIHDLDIVAPIAA